MKIKEEKVRGKKVKQLRRYFNANVDKDAPEHIRTWQWRKLKKAWKERVR
jgi:hypothetical protein